MRVLPKTKIGIVAVSRDCFPESLSVNRRKALVEAYTKKYGADDIYECPVCIVESEIQMVEALEDIKKAGCDSLCVYLGNFGPEISETLLAKHFDGPVMFCAAAEESGNSLMDGRGDAYPAGLCAAKGQGRRLVWEFAVFSPGLRHGNAGGVLRPERRTAAAAQGAAGEHSGVPADGRFLRIIKLK